MFPKAPCLARSASFCLAHCYLGPYLGTSIVSIFLFQITRTLIFTERNLERVSNLAPPLKRYSSPSMRIGKSQCFADNHAFSSQATQSGLYGCNRIMIPLSTSSLARFDDIPFFVHGCYGWRVFLAADNRTTKASQNRPDGH